MPPRSPEFLSSTATHSALPAADPAAEAAAGLSQPVATVSPKFLYDALGSALFNAITALPEYYPTRVEAGILAAHRSEIAATLQQWLANGGQGITLVDLGAGDGAKASRLFHDLQVARYVAVDISEDFLRQALDALQRQFPALDIVGAAMDFSQRLALPAGLIQAPSLVFYPGSSIGNFSPDSALRLLREMHAASNGGALLIGADLHKPTAVLQAAYDDALGVTAAFNLNLLQHLNRLIGSDFDVRQWQHVALFNAPQSRVEMHLQARHNVGVQWRGGKRHFAAGDRIHTENSHKWSSAAFESLLRDAGWRQVRRFTDADDWFGVFLARA